MYFLHRTNKKHESTSQSKGNELEDKNKKLRKKKIIQKITLPKKKKFQRNQIKKILITEMILKILKNQIEMRKKTKIMKMQNQKKNLE